MSKTVLSLALLVPAFTLPLAAHADAIDDFVLTGNGTTITFSLPASPAGNQMTCPVGIVTSCLPGSETAFSVSTLVTTNGISTEEGLTFPTDRFGGGLLLGSLDFHGDQALFAPDAANPTFLIGMFQLDMINPSGSPPSLDYSLTIAPEAAAAATPEPASMALLATGVLGLIGFAGMRRRRGVVE